MGQAATSGKEPRTGQVGGGAAGRSSPTEGRAARGGRRAGDRTRRLLALLGLLGPLGYLVLVTVLGLLWDGYDPVRDTQSELGAVDAPHRLVMNVAGFMGLGVSILAFAAAYWLLLAPSWAKMLATGLLAVAGLGMVVVGFFPCDAGCVDVTGTGRLHSLFSMPGAIGLPAAAMVSALAFRLDGRFTMAWQVASFWLGLVSLASGPIIAAELAGGINGLLQRAAMWTPLVWMMAVSLRLSGFARTGGRGPAAVGPSNLPPAGLLGWVRRHPLGAFYAVTFLISWGYWMPDAISGGHRSHIPGLVGPMVAALVVTGLVEGAAGLRDLLARMGRWRVPPRWYLAAAAPLALALGVAAVVSLGPGRFPTLTDWVRMEGFPAVGVVGSFALILMVNAYGEETGWRGFALPRLRRRHGRLQASFLVAVPWMLWHLPTFFLDTGYRGFNPVLVPGLALGIFAGAVVLTWLYEGARSSILVVALWHAFLNLGSATRAGQGAVQVSVTMLVIVWSLVIAHSWHGHPVGPPHPVRVTTPS